MKEIKWENYGDINPIEHGGMFVKYDSQIGGRCYYAVSLTYIEGEGKWLLIDGYIDLDDDWIEWDKIKDTMDTPDNADDEYLATDVMHYYGGHIGDEHLLDREEEVREFLKQCGIEVEDN